MLNHIDTSRIYKTQWMAHFKNELAAPTIVYGESEVEARTNALAYYRKNKSMVDLWPCDKVVAYVEYIG